MSHADHNQQVYEATATGFDARRNRGLFEIGWLRRFAATLPSGAHVLDIGCGSGEPIASWLISHGFRVTGIDFAPAMLQIARNRWPDGDWREGDMRTLDLPDRFDGIIGWDSFFHLTEEEQHSCIPRLARHLKPDGTLMLTIGPARGSATGTVEGQTVYHASLSVADYATCLESCGMRMTGYMAEDPDCDYHSILLARRVH